MAPIQPFRIRMAEVADVPALVSLLADDALGASREQPGDPVYAAAFAAITAQPGNMILLVEEADGQITGCLQLTFIAGLSRRGTLRAQLESVRIAGSHRGLGRGEALVNYAIAKAEAAGAGLVQLTTDATRHNAQRFYQRLGFSPTHVGMKLILA